MASKSKCYEEQLRELQVFHLEKGSLRGAVITLQLPKRRLYQGMGSLQIISGTKQHSLKLLQGSFRLYIRKNSITEWVVNHWNGLLWKVV